MGILAVILVVAFVALAFYLQARKRSQERAAGYDVYAAEFDTNDLAWWRDE